MACYVLSAVFWTDTAAAVSSYHLAPPFDVKAVRLKVGKPDTSKFSCGQPPAPMKDLQMESFYNKDDTSFSIVDPEALAAYKKATKPASVFEIGLTSMANRYVRSSPPRAEVAVCDLDWLAVWAEEGALLGDVNKNGEYTRKWLLGSIASVWIQIRDEPSLDPDKRKKVVDWIRRVAETARADFSRNIDLKSRQNNHLYWAAWGVGVAGLAIDDKKLFDWAVSKAREGVDDIQPDGTLPLELARGQRAYLYHLFSALPLFMLADAAEKNGIEIFHQNDSGLQRLGELCLKNLGDPDDFTELTGKKQETTRVGTSSDLGWVEIYRQHYRDSLADAALKKFRPMKRSRFGGDITLLYGKIRMPSSGKTKS